MTEPITVANALKALRMLKEVGEKATPMPRLSLGNESSLVIAMRNRDANQAFHDAARAVLPGMVEYLIGQMAALRYEGEIPVVMWPQSSPELHAAIAPIVAWARTRKEWSK